MSSEYGHDSLVPHFKKAKLNPSTNQSRNADFEPDTKEKVQENSTTDSTMAFNVKPNFGAGAKSLKAHSMSTTLRSHDSSNAERLSFRPISMQPMPVHPDQPHANTNFNNHGSPVHLSGQSYHPVTNHTTLQAGGETINSSLTPQNTQVRRCNIFIT